MQPPFAAGIDQPVAHQRLQDMPPAGSLARVRQALCPEPIELQLLVEMTRKPAGSPLPRAAQFHGIEPDLQPVATGVLRNVLPGRKQRELSMLLAAFVKSIDHPAPGLALAVVDLAEIKHWPLYYSTAGATLTFDNAPVTVLLAVLPSSSESQIHQPRFYSDQNARKGSRSSLQRLSMNVPLSRLSFCLQKHRKSLKTRSSWEGQFSSAQLRRRSHYKNRPI